MTPTEAHEQLDTNGWLGDSREAGVYALAVETPPDDPRAVFERWTASHDHAPQHVIDSLADAERLAYVGESGCVYDRLMDHCRGDVRQTALLRVFPPTEVLGVEVDASEFNYAREWVGRGWAVWRDGMVALP